VSPVFIAQFSYPTNWKSISTEESRPFDWHPMFDKEAVWLARSDNSMFQLQRNFVWFAKETFGCSEGRNCKLERGSILSLAKDLSPPTVHIEKVGFYNAVSAYKLYASHRGDVSQISRLRDSNFSRSVNGSASLVMLEEEIPVCGLYIWQEGDSASGSTHIPSIRATMIDNSGEEVLSGAELMVVRVSEFHKRVAGGRLIEFDAPKCQRASSIRVFMTSVSEANESADQTTILGAKLIGDRGFALPIPSTDPNMQKAVVSVDSKGLLLRMENFHPGWNVLVNGVQGEIFSSKENFQIVEIPAGLHLVEFTYWSIYDQLHRVFRNGLAGVYLLLLFALFSMGRKERSVPRIDSCV